MVANIQRTDERSSEEKGKDGENLFNKWLQSQDFSYLYINQSPKDYFAPLFKGNIKRPDFLLLIESVGLIGIDVKNYRWNGKDYGLNFEDELKKVLAFERVFRIPVWYAYVSDRNSGEDWYWISALKAVEVGVLQKSPHGEFLRIDLKHFAKVRTGSDLGQLYTQRVPGFEKIANLLS